MISQMTNHKSSLLGCAAEDNEEEIDGWDMIHRPVGWSGGSHRSTDALPPPPSENDEAITHWERAMFVDSNSHLLTQSPARRVITSQIAPLKQGAYAAAERLWQGLTRAS